MEKAKLKGGPWDGRYYDVQDQWSKIVLRMPVQTKISYWDYPDQIQPLESRVGDYLPSNRILKDGTRVYQWMGWQDGKA